MSDSAGANSNSWTILTQNETQAENLRPLAEGTERHEDNGTSTSENTGCSTDTQLGEGSQSAAKNQQTSGESMTALSGGTSAGFAQNPDITPTQAGDATPPSALDVVSRSFDDGDMHSQSEGLPEGPVESGPDPDSFSDSYTHISPSPDEPPGAQLTTETLRSVEMTEEAERFSQEGPGQSLDEEGPGPVDEESEQSQRDSDSGRRSDPKIGEEGIEDVGEAEVRRRRRSLLAALERIGRREEEDEGEEEFQPPQRADDSGFSVNKCILGAVILLGLGTIFFSGVFMDLDEESDYGPRELKDTEGPIKQEWLNPDGPQAPVDTESTELLNKLAKEKQQIDVLQAHLKAHQEELKVAKGQAAEGANELRRREEMERENGRLKKEMASLPVLQKENERMKRELESVPALQKELETLRSAVAGLKLSAVNEASPPPVTPTETPTAGQGGDSMPAVAGSTEKQAKKPGEGVKVEKKREFKKEKYDVGEEWKDRNKMERKEAQKKEPTGGGDTYWEGKEVKKPEHDQGKGKDVKGWRQKGEKKEDWKREKASRGDDGKPWKDSEGQKEWKGRNERKHWNEETELNEGQSERLSDGERKDKDEKKDGKGRKEHAKWQRGKEEWEPEVKWKKGKERYKEGGKEWKEEIKDGSEKEWKKSSGQKSKGCKDLGRERPGREERKTGGKKERSEDAGWKREGRREERNHGDWKKDKESPYREEHKHKKPEHRRHASGSRNDHHWQGPAGRKPSPDHPDYWVHQRERVQQNRVPPHHCVTVETCAQAEGLLPVHLSEFQDVLQGYLARAAEAGADPSKAEELTRLVTEFFRDGVFAHDRMSFRDFAEDVADILEDMVEGDSDDEGDGDGEGEEDAIEEEMEKFEGEVVKRFSAQRPAPEIAEGKKGELKKESGRGRG